MWFIPTVFNSQSLAGGNAGSRMTGVDIWVGESAGLSIRRVQIGGIGDPQPI